MSAHQERLERYQLEQRNEEIKMQRRLRTYSGTFKELVKTITDTSLLEPPLKHSVDLNWPVREYSTRRSTTDPMPMLFFDISHNPNNPSPNTLLLMREEGQEVPEGLLAESMQLEFSTSTRFTTIKLKCEEPELENWDVTVERPDGIRIIDIFEEIFKTYNLPLKTPELLYYRDILDSASCQQAFERRCKETPGSAVHTRRRGMCRIDLVGSRTLFNGIFFNDDIGQYHFQLLEQHPINICLSPLSA
ncbi:hypothetical protein DXG01_011616 [Tephrocybe rancida]|nr:hypothetical protein DXG01_011616 [Tephrocybe rancida]